MSDTPSAQIIARAGQTTEEMDDLGRKIRVKRMLVSERLRFLKAVPAALQSNPLWVSNAMAIASVVDMDGTPLPPIHDEASIERAGDLLGDEGLASANIALERLLGAAMTKKETLAQMGELAGTPNSANASGS